MFLPIGTAIKELRRQREITQNELAKVLGVSAQAVSRWERGYAYPDLELLPVIAAYFDVSVERLLGMDEHK